MTPRAIKELGVTFPIVLDKTGSVSAAFKCEIIPYLVVVDIAGIVRYTHVGFDPTLTQRLSKLIEQYRKR